MSSVLGTTLNGRYRLESRIGSGGMATVYRARDETLERFVAIKLMNREVIDDSDQLERFRREARAVARLSHPNIVHVIDAGEDEHRPYIVFECIDGETLKARIRRLGRLAITEAVADAVEIARALSAAHAQHIVHRDIKPQNVLIDRDGVPKITDFGIARTLEEEGLTTDGRVLGTTDYVSPEQALGRPATAQSDQYSLGIVLYEMLTGELPFRAETQLAVAMQHIREPFPNVRELRPEVSAALAALLERLTAKDPLERYADDAELIADLEQVLVIEAGHAGVLDTHGARGSVEGRVGSEGSPTTDDQQTTDDQAIANDQAIAHDQVAGDHALAEEQVTTVIESLPIETRRRAPRRAGAAGGRRGTYAVGLLLVMAIAGAVVAVILGGGNGRGGGGSGTLTPIAICSRCAHAYNPDFTSGGTYQDDQEAPNAVDGNARTAWSTEDYDGGVLGKKGVGLYVWTSAPVAARQLDVETATPGFDATVYGSTRQPDLTSFASSGWQQLASATDVSRSQSLSWNGARSYRYFLVWITRLPRGEDYASLNEIRLYR